MTTIRPLSTYGTMTRKAFALLTPSKGVQETKNITPVVIKATVTKKKAATVATKTPKADQFAPAKAKTTPKAKQVKPSTVTTATKKKPAIVTTKTPLSADQFTPAKAKTTTHVKPDVKKPTPIANTYAEKFAHNLTTVEGLPDNVVMAADRVIYTTGVHAGEPSKTIDEARRALSCLVSNPSPVGTRTQEIIMKEAQRANLKSVQLFELA